jgi:hypothetical protein
VYKFSSMEVSSSSVSAGILVGDIRDIVKCSLVD